MMTTGVGQENDGGARSGGAGDRQHEEFYAEDGLNDDVTQAIQLGLVLQ